MIAVAFYCGLSNFVECHQVSFKRQHKFNNFTEKIHCVYAKVQSSRISLAIVLPLYRKWNDFLLFVFSILNAGTRHQSPPAHHQMCWYNKRLSIFTCFAKTPLEYRENDSEHIKCTLYVRCIGNPLAQLHIFLFRSFSF